MNNLVVLTGLLGRDLELRSTTTGKNVASGSIAVQDGFGDTKKTQWFNFVIWDDYAVAAAEVLKKGTKTTLIGRLSSRKFKDSAGNDREKVEIVVASFGAPQPRKEKQEAPPPASLDDDSVPF